MSNKVKLGGGGQWDGAGIPAHSSIHHPLESSQSTLIVVGQQNNCPC